MIFNQILCLGDSMTSGARDEYGLGYPPILADMLTDELKGQEWLCINKGIVRETSSELLFRAYDVVRAYPECQTVLLLTGTNDLKHVSTPPPVFQNTYNQLLRICRVFGKRIIVGLIPPVDSMGMFCFDQDSNDIRKKYNDSILYLSGMYGLTVTDFSDMSKYLVDGVHFGHKGYMEMAKRWLLALRKL